MICKFCGAEVEEGQPFCHACGKELTEDQISGDPVEEIVTEETTEATAEEQTAQDAVAENAVEEKPKKSVAPLVLSIIAAVLALASLAVLLMLALGVDFKSFLPRKNDILKQDSYIAADDVATKKGDVVVATIGDKNLTNAQLQIYYRMQVMDFLNYYGSYATQLGLDVSLPLSEQTCYFDQEKTWEQYLLDVAIDTWQNYQVMGVLAEEAGFELTGEWKESYEQLPEDLLEQAKQSGFDTVDALLKDVIGPNCSEEVYMEYVLLAYTCNAYYDTITEEMTPTDDEIAAYFEENATTFAEEGITKEMGNIADVRHILICPTGGTTDELTGETTYSEEEWADCLKKAEKILDEWKSGEATEDSFAKLAGTYTEDTGSVENGGLYEDIAPGDSYVENFLNWTIDMNRKIGDTDIVKTEYGYHIMYYVGGEPYWISVAGTQLLSDRITEMTETAEKKMPMKVNYGKIALSELEFE